MTNSIAISLAKQARAQPPARFPQRFVFRCPITRAERSISNKVVVEPHDEQHVRAI
jgi:hypothetical protein